MASENFGNFFDKVDKINIKSNGEKLTSPYETIGNKISDLEENDLDSFPIVGEDKDGNYIYESKDGSFFKVIEIGLKVSCDSNGVSIDYNDVLYPNSIKINFISDEDKTLDNYTYYGLFKLKTDLKTLDGVSMKFLYGSTFDSYSLDSNGILTIHNMNINIPYSINNEEIIIYQKLPNGDQIKGSLEIELK